MLCNTKNLMDQLPAQGYNQKDATLAVVFLQDKMREDDLV